MFSESSLVRIAPNGFNPLVCSVVVGRCIHTPPGTRQPVPCVLPGSHSASTTQPAISVLTGSRMTLRCPNVLALIALLDDLDEYVDINNCIPCLRNPRQLTAQSR